MHNTNIKCEKCNHEIAQTVELVQQNSKSVKVRYSDKLSATFKGAKYIQDEETGKNYIVIPECIYCENRL